jgi:hypothetical protein
MAGRTIREQVEALPDAERMGVKLRAKAVKDEVLNRVPDLCRAPFENMLHETCVVCAFDDHESGNTHDGETLCMVRDIVDGMGDRHDVNAMRADAEAEVVQFRELEEGCRRMSRAVEDMRQEGFSLSPQVTADAGPVPGR